MSVLGKNAVLLVKEYDITSSFREMEVGASLEELDDTTYGPTNDKTYQQGIESGETSMGGFWTGGVGSVDERMNAIFGGQGGAVTIGPDVPAMGSRDSLFKAKNIDYSISSAKGELVGVAVSLSHGSAMGMGVWLHDRVARTASGNGTVVDNGSSTSNGYAATLHVVGFGIFGDPILNVKVQHSADNFVWVDLVSFEQQVVGSNGWDYKSGSKSTVNRYVRAVWAISGTNPSWTFAVGFARLYQ